MRRPVLALLAATFCCAAPARADAYDDNPAAASRGPGDMVVLARGADGATYERHVFGGAWTAWESIGGVAISGPAAAAYGSTIHAFVTGTDTGVYENVLQAGGWSGWASVGPAQASSAPAAISRRGTNVLDLAVRGTDNAAYQKWFQPGSGWSAWTNLGGNLTSGLALNSQDPGVLNVWARAIDGQLAQRAWNGSAWGDWALLGGGIVGAPAVVSRQANMVDMFARGNNRAVYQKHWDGGAGWGGWALLDPMPVDSTPAVVSDAPGHVVLFARSGGGLAVKEWRAESGWTAWTGWGPVAPPSPPPPPPPPPPPQDGIAELTTGLRCTPPGGRLRVSLRIRTRAGAPRAHVRRVVFFVRHGPHRTDRHRPYLQRLRLNRKAGSKGRVYARAYYTRSGSHKVRRKTVSRRFVMCG